MDPVARQVLELFPLPNQPGNAVTGRAELLRHRHGGAERRQRRRPASTISCRTRRGASSATRTGRLQRPGAFFPDDIAIAEGRVNEQNPRHNAVIDYNRTMSNTTVLSARFGFARTLFIFDNQGLASAVEPRAPVGDRRERRSADVPALRRRRLTTLRRQQSPLQRVHELHHRRQPDQSAGHPRAEGRDSKAGCCASTSGRHAAPARSTSARTRRRDRTRTPRAAPPDYGFASFLLGTGRRTTS